MIYYTLSVTAQNFASTDYIKFELSLTSEHQRTVNSLERHCKDHCIMRGLYFRGFALADVEIDDRTDELTNINSQGVKITQLTEEQATENLLNHSGGHQYVSIRTLRLYNTK